MLETASEDFKIKFLLAFTKKLIETNSPLEVMKFDKRIKEDEENLKKQILSEKKEQTQFIKKAIKENEDRKDLIIPTQRKILPQKHLPPQRRIIKIPEMRLPPHLQYLKPDFSRSKRILNLQKLNPLIKNPTISDIIVNGPDQNVIVKSPSGTKTTDIVLNKEDIEYIISKFSEASRIPANEGLFKVAYGPFILNAIISKVTGSRFVLKRISYNRFFK